MTRDYINFGKMYERADSLTSTLEKMQEELCEAAFHNHERLENDLEMVIDRCFRILAHAYTEKRNFDAAFIKRHLSVIIGDCEEIQSNEYYVKPGKDASAADIIGTVNCIQQLAEDAHSIIKELV